MKLRGASLGTRFFLGLFVLLVVGILAFGLIVARRAGGEVEERSSSLLRESREEIEQELDRAARTRAELMDEAVLQLSERFGVELSFARTLLQLDPNASIAIIKYSRGGSSIDRDAADRFGCWDPDYPDDRSTGVNQYDHFLATIRHALAIDDIDGDGQPDTLVPKGIIWMQGESDAAHGEEIARRYEANLERLMDLVRAALRSDDIPVVIGWISAL